MTRKKVSSGQRTATARQRARTERLAQAGLKLARVIVPVAREAEIKAIAVRMCEEAKS